MRRTAKVRVELVKEKSVYSNNRLLDTPQKAAEFARDLYYEFDEKGSIRQPAKEIVSIIAVDVKGKPYAVEHISIGTTSSAVIDMKSLFTTPLLCGASEVIVVHNHPSGDPLPSIEDQLMTKRIESAGKLLDIPMRDHIILGEGGYYSYKDKTVFQWKEELKKVC